MWKKLVLFFVVTTSLLSYTASSPADNNDSSRNTTCVEKRDENYDCSSVVGRAKTALLKFSFQFLNQLIKYQKGVLVAVPINVYIILGIAAQYGYDKTLSEILNFMGLDNKNQAPCVLQTLVNELPSNSDYATVVYSLNAVADSRRFIFHENTYFMKDLAAFGNGKAKNSNYTNPNEAATLVNEAVANGTNNYVTDVVSQSNASKFFNDNTYIDFFTGIYFQALWETAFNKNNITTGFFTKSTFQVIKVPYVWETKYYDYTYSKKLKAKIILKPRVDGYATYIILPDSICGTQRIAKMLSKNPEIFKTEIARLTKTLVNLYIPKLKNCNATNYAVPIVKSTHEVDSAFDINKAQFENTCGENILQAISYMVQKVVVTQNLDGAKPYVEADIDSADRPVNFYATRPTILITVKNDIVLLIGTFEY